MYCSNCATQIKPELNYCNSCGQRVESKFDNGFDQVAKTLSSAVIYVGVFALIGFIFLVKSLLDYGVSDGRLVALASIYLTAVVGIIYMIMHRIGFRKPEAMPQQHFQEKEAPAFQPVDTNRLEPPREQPASVIENTTRTLDKVSIERD